MSELSLEYFAEIGSKLNISQAAKQLHISQQSLSVYLQKLEADYGTQLLVRRPSMQLTEAGEMLYDAACRIRRIQKNVRMDIQRITAPKAFLSIGIYAPNAPMLMDFIPLIEFGKKWPDVAYNITEAQNLDLRAMLGKGKLDLIISAYSKGVQFSEFEVKKLYTNVEYIIIADQLLQRSFPDSYPENIRQFRQGVRLEQFKDVPLVMPPAATGFSRGIYRFCEESELKMNIIGEISNRYLSNSMVLDGLAFGFSDRRYLAYLQRTAQGNKVQQLHAFPLVSPDQSNSVGVMYRRSENHPLYFQDLVDMIIQKNAQEEFQPLSGWQPAERESQRAGGSGSAV